MANIPSPAMGGNPRVVADPSPKAFNPGIENLGGDCTPELDALSSSLSSMPWAKPTSENGAGYSPLRLKSGTIGTVRDLFSSRCPEVFDALQDFLNVEVGESWDRDGAFFSLDERTPKADGDGFVYWSLAEVYRSRLGSNRKKRLRGIEQVLWQVRLLAAAGMLDPPEVPGDFEHEREAIAMGLDGIRILFQVRAALGLGPQACVSKRFLVEWAGIREYEALSAIRYALKVGLIRKAGERKTANGTAFLYGLGGQS